MKDAMDEKQTKNKIRKNANLSQPWNFTFFESEIYQPFFQFHAPEVLEWKTAHSLWYKKAQNTGKSKKKWLCYKPEKFTRRFGIHIKGHHGHLHSHNLFLGWTHIQRSNI